MSNYTAGHDAEKVAADYLERQGYAIRALNWKTRYCEVDIIAEKNKTIYFVEVKYRKNANQGTGFDYITVKKLKQMAFAAEFWVQEHNWRGDYQLAAIEVQGVPPEVVRVATDCY